MRTATNITVKRKRVGTNYCRIVLPSEGDILDLGDEVLKVTSPVVLKENTKVNTAEFSLETDGITMTINIKSQKPFRKK